MGMGAGSWGAELLGGLSPQPKRLCQQRAHGNNEIQAHNRNNGKKKKKIPLNKLGIKGSRCSIKLNILTLSNEVNSTTAICKLL